MNASLLPLALFAPVLVFAGASDLWRMRIPNWASLVALAIFVAAMPFIGWPEVGWRALAAGVVLAVGMGLWALRLFGAGDVKLLSALLLLIPSYMLPQVPMVLAASLLVGLVAVTSLRASGLLRSTGWVSMRARGQFPMGVSIALCGLVFAALLATA